MSKMIDTIKWYGRPFYPFLESLKRSGWFYTEAHRLLQFNNRHKGQDCFIIGNGPSLKKMDLSPLAEYHTFGLNKIYMMEGVDLNLSYLVSVQEQVIEQSVEAFSRMTHPVFIDYYHGKKYLPRKKHFYYLMNGYRPKSFGTDPTKPLVYGHTVTYVAMQLAYYMGFKRVFLIGVDHSFAQKGNPNEVQTMEHDDPNHFHPDYFKGHRWQLADLDGSELSYQTARLLFNRDERLIFDATVGGKLEVFPKISYEEALQTAAKK